VDAQYRHPFTAPGGAFRIVWPAISLISSAFDIGRRPCRQ